MVGSTYISNPEAWKDFYHKMTTGTLKTDKYKGHQVGGGISGMYSNKPYMIPIRLHTAENKSKETVKEITPTAADEARAQSEFNDAVKNDAPRVPIKGKKRKRKVSSKKTTKRETSQKKKKAVKRKQTKKGQKRKSTSDSNNIFKKLKYGIS